MSKKGPPEPRPKGLEKIAGIGGDNNGNRNITIFGNAMGSTFGDGAAVFNQCTLTINNQAAGEKKELLEELEGMVEDLVKKLVEKGNQEVAQEAAEDFKILVETATAEKPREKWYSVSAKGLVEAAGFVKDFTGNIGGTLFNLGKAIFGGGFSM